MNNQTISDKTHIAEEFNSYFLNIGTKLAEKIMPTKNFIEYLNRPASTLFYFHPLKEKETLRNIQNLKKISLPLDTIVSQINC